MKKPLEVLNLYPPHDYTLQGAFASRAARAADRAFVLHGDRTWTWHAFEDEVSRIASLLLGRGITKGHRVAVIGRNSDGHVLMLFAMARIGAIMVPVNPEFGVEEARYVLHHAEVSGVVASRDVLAVARAASAGMKKAPWFLGLGGADDGVEGLSDAARNAPPRVLPLFHINALFYSVAGTLAAGCSMAIVPRFSASTFWQTAVDYQATEVNIIEAIGTILKNRPRSEFRPEHRLRAVYGVRHSMEATFRDEFRIQHLIGGYGMTEIPGVTCNPLEGLRKPGSMGPIGRHPDPSRAWAQCRVADDEGRDVGVNEEGELLVKTPIVMQGYFRDPVQTGEAFENGWFKTGDIVKRDEDGHFFFVARKKDIIRRRGENIAGAELDRVIGSHPAVHEAAAIPVPAELGEDEILVGVVLKPGETATAQDIAQWCRQHLAPQKVPRYVLFLDDLPHTPTHKVAKAVLRKDTTLKERATDLESAMTRRDT